MSEYGEGKPNLETLFREQLRPLNEAVVRVVGGHVPPVAAEAVNWISSTQAEEIRQRKGDRSRSPCFATDGQIYFVRELVAERHQDRQRLPPPFNSPEVDALFMLAHESLHLGCRKAEGGAVTRDVASICWQALYQDLVDLSGDEVPEEVKEGYREINRQLEAAGEARRIQVEGTSITIGTPEYRLYEFGEQTNEDFIDLLAAMAMADYITHTVRVRPGEVENLTKQLWAMNLPNRLSRDPADIMALWTQSRRFVEGRRMERFSNAYFGGQFYDEFAAQLDDTEGTYFSAYLVLGATADALKVVLDKEKASKKKR